MPPIRTALLAAALSAPLAAQGFTVPPSCVVDAGTGTIHPAADPRGTDVVWPQGWPGEIVTFDWLDDAGRMHAMIQHCPTGTTLRYAIAYARFEALRARIEGMLTSDITYGFDDLRHEIRASGGRARMVPAPGPCGCDHALAH